MSRNFSLNEVDSFALENVIRSFTSISTSHLLSRTLFRLALQRVSSFLDDISHEGDSGIKKARHNAIVGTAALINANVSQSNTEPNRYSIMTPAHGTYSISWYIIRQKNEKRRGFYIPKDVPTDANAANTPRRCGCDTSAVYTLDGAPIIPELRPARNLPM